jgi:uncharacterized FlaG/YvyC family protein
MGDISPIVSEPATLDLSLKSGLQADESSQSQKRSRPDVRAEAAMEVREQDAVKAAADVEAAVNSVADTALSFSVDKELSRMIITVTAVGSDEIIRQFPPEEFITVAKVIAAQNPDTLDEDFLKGILFDQYS